MTKPTNGQRLDALEGKMDLILAALGAQDAQPEQAVTDEYAGWDWNEDPAAEPMPVAAVAAAPAKRVAFPRPGQPPQPAPSNGFIPASPGADWVPGEAKLPVSDSPIGEGRGTVGQGFGVFMPDGAWLAASLERDFYGPARHLPRTDDGWAQ